MATVGIDTDRLDELKAAVAGDLNAHNDQFLPSPCEPSSIAISARDDVGVIVGGLVQH
jgi:hypothetical protein